MVYTLRNDELKGVGVYLVEDLVDMTDSQHFVCLFGWLKRCKATCDTVQARPDQVHDPRALASEEGHRFNFTPWYNAI